MTVKKVPIIDYSTGSRKIIGEAVVDTDGEYWDISGKITDPDYHLPGTDLTCLSIGNSEAATIPKESRVKQKKSKKRSSS